MTKTQKARPARRAQKPKPVMLQVRLAPEIHDRLVSASKQSGKSMNSEVVSRLLSSEVNRQFKSLIKEAIEEYVAADSEPYIQDEVSKRVMQARILMRSASDVLKNGCPEAKDIVDHKEEILSQLPQNST